ncbi:PREDICTED: CLK4-associating serine/arginine rich protein-like isoform X1 [Amphimedon queenslandica]|uniref:Suppressor of white apricot N-terminal domain-containing protein n=2 Tax=Amphimedon queenslandica TaxID=400682 RepID=A0A1X7UYD1_AMPQE|nr:PREDICTED: CLK4-associating serine/arginine rich protein-like isoform X1 [Amphimedon queenslandica]|eukprot:XP_019851575.1 PREDICTED: CLK4-associating serine/arginine rich protein-like isoform X1 [Amphimedon queenslandica]
MWHEARKQEKKIREVMVDFQRRAERRREHYDKLKADPTSYLRIIGSKCRLHIDPTGGERYSSTMIPWQGDEDNLISRYDVRIHMDIIPDYSKLPEIELSGEEKYEETKINYERYRSVIINEFNNVPESEVLSKIDVDELYSDVKRAKKGNKKQSKNKSAISYDYDSQQQMASDANKKKRMIEDDDKDSNDETEDEMDFDIDTFSSGQIDKLNVLALDYKVSQGYFSRSVRSEKNLLMERKQAKMAELEKSNLTGKKARKERRLFKEMSLRTRMPSPPLFVPKDIYNPKKQRDDDEESNTSSSSGSVSLDSKPQFITEFGSDVPSLPASSSTLDHVTKPCLPFSSSSRKKRRRSSSSSSSSTSSRSDSSSPRRKKRSYHSSSSHHHAGDRDKERRSSHSSSGRDHSRWRRSRSRSIERVSALTKSKLEAKKPQPKKKSLPSLQQKQQQEKTKLTPQERLKKKMQSQLSKTFKEDKKVEKYKAEVKEVERIEREEKMKQETLKLRRRAGYDDFYDRSSRYSRSPSPRDRYHRH